MPGGHKYRAVRTQCAQGHSHPSKAESRRCDELTILERAGEIKHLQREVAFPVFVNGVKVCTYKADFVYFTKKERIVEDVKGAITPVYRLKKKLVEAYYLGTKIAEVRA